MTMIMGEAWPPMAGDVTTHSVEAELTYGTMLRGRGIHDSDPGAAIPNVHPLLTPDIDNCGNCRTARIFTLQNGKI